MPVVPATGEAEAGEWLEAGIAPLHSSLGDRVRHHLKNKKRELVITKIMPFLVLNKIETEACCVANNCLEFLPLRNPPALTSHSANRCEPSHPACLSEIERQHSRPGVVADACDPSTLEGQGGWIT